MDLKKILCPKKCWSKINLELTNWGHEKLLVVLVSKSLIGKHHLVCATTRFLVHSLIVGFGGVLVIVLVLLVILVLWTSNLLKVHKKLMRQISYL